MPEIASPKAAAPSHAQAPARRSAQPADPASSSPFASHLEASDAQAPAPQQQTTAQPAADQTLNPDGKTTQAASDDAKPVADGPGITDAAQTAIVPTSAAVAAAAATTAAAGAASAAKTGTGGAAAPADAPASKADGSADKTEKNKDAQTTDAAATALALAAGQPTVSSPPAAPAAIAVAVQATQQVAASPAATVAAVVVAKIGQPAVLPKALGGTSASGTGKTTDAKAEAGKDADKSAAATANPDATKTASAGPDGSKVQAVPTKTDATNSDGAQQPPPQPDPNAQAAAPANGAASAPATPDAAARIVAAAGKTDAAPRRDADVSSAPITGTNALAPAGGDITAASQAASAAAATASGTASATATAATSAAPAAAGAPLPVAVPLSGLAIEIAGRAKAGKNDFAIRLDPPELGRIEVKLSVDRQGQITSHVIADRSDTLDLLRRDASGLQRSLQDAGLKMSGNGLQFSLRDQSSSGGQNTGGRRSAPQIVVQDTLSVDSPRVYTAYGSRVGGLDIRV